MSLRTLFIGDIVGGPGRRIIRNMLPALRAEHAIDFCIANAENASGGSGLTQKNARELFKASIDVITLGDHVWKQKELATFIESEPRILRPQNHSPLSLGTGMGVYTLPSGARIGVLNLIGRVFIRPADCPFRAADDALKELREETPNIFVDIHAEATAEKIALGWHLDGRATAVIGTHTHVQTADERLLHQGTAFLCDAGMTGPHESVLGRRIDRVLKATITQMPCPFDVAKNDVRLCGAIVTFDETSGRATAIERIVLKEDQTP